MQALICAMKALISAIKAKLCAMKALISAKEKHAGTLPVL